MFYCEPCRAENNWPDSISRSSGKCECCGKSAICWDRPSSSLPPAKRVELSNTQQEENQDDTPVGVLSKLEKLIGHYGLCCGQQASWSTGNATPSKEARAKRDPRAAHEALMSELRKILSPQYKHTTVRPHNNGSVVSEENGAAHVVVHIPLDKVTVSDCHRFGLDIGNIRQEISKRS